MIQQRKTRKSTENEHGYILEHVTAKRFYRSNLFAYMSKASLKKGDSRLKESLNTNSQDLRNERAKLERFESTRIWMMSHRKSRKTNTDIF